MIVIPSDEVEGFLANESGTKFTEEQIAFFRQSKKNYMKLMEDKC